MEPSSTVERTTSDYREEDVLQITSLARQLQAPAPALPPDQVIGLSLTILGARFLEKATTSVRTAVRIASGESGRLRDERLERLFREISMPIEDAVGEKLRGTSAAVEGLDLRFPTAYYYALLASHYCKKREAYEELYNEFANIWANVHLPILFAALAFRAVFVHETEHSLKDLNEVKKGVNRLFWVDLQRSALAFFPVYKYLREEVLFNTQYWSQPFVQRSLLSIFRVLARFHLFYEPAALLPGLVTKLNQRQKDWVATGGANNSLSGQPLSDIVASEIADQLHLIKNTEVLIIFLRGCIVLKEFKFSEVATPLKLQAVLYNMSAPGGPFYAPRNVRSAAYLTLKTLFPVRRLSRFDIHVCKTRLKGKLVRNIVYALFRMCYPYYALHSILHHLAVLFWTFLAYLAFWRRFWPRTVEAL